MQLLGIYPLDLEPGPRSPLEGWAIDRRPQGERWHWYRLTGKALCSRSHYVGPVRVNLPEGTTPCRQCEIRLAIRRRREAQPAERDPADGAAPVTIHDANIRLLARSFDSAVCPLCGGPKTPGLALCGREFAAQPPAMRSALRTRIGAGEGYESGLIGAFALAGRSVFHLPPQRKGKH